MLVCLSFACLIATVVTTTYIILSFNNIQNGNSLVSANPSPPEKWPLKRRESNIYTILCNKMLLGYQKSDAEVAVVASANDNNNNNTSICKAHNVSIRAESEAPAVARWRGWLEG